MNKNDYYKSEELRYETKFRVIDSTYSQIVNIIKSNPATFRETYNQRVINNIYFDDNILTNYRDNIEGEKNRKKIRIRWYGKQFGLCRKPVLEIKYKTGLLGWKERYNLNEFNLNKNDYFNFKNIFDYLNKNKNINILKLNLKDLSPTLLNSYHRTYYISFDKKYRITVDKNMNFFSINPIRKVYKTLLDNDHTIIELKYKKLYYEGAKNITNYFPFRITKNSKYVVGIEKLRT